MELSKDLLGKSTVKRRKAAIAIRKNELDGYSNILLEALKIEKNKNHNDTETELITTLGYKGGQKAESYIFKEYVQNGFFLANSVAAYVRLRNYDISLIKEFLKKGDYSAKVGVLNVLGYDRIVPELENQDEILSLCFDFGKDRRKELGDPRYGLAAACAGWKSDKVELFLKECLKSGDVPLEYVAKKSLESKYVKLR